MIINKLNSIIAQAEKNISKQFIMINELNTILSNAIDSQHKMIKEKIDTEQCRKIISISYNQAYDAYTSGIYLYRGNKGDDEIFIAKSGIRKSKDTVNVYNVLISEILPGWKDYPKRNKSIIMTNKLAVANTYAENADGSIYLVFPYNNATLAISPTGDFWDAFAHSSLFTQYGEGDLNEFNESITSLITSILLVFKKEVRDDSNRFSIEYTDVSNTFAANDVKKVLSYFEYCQSALKGLNDEEKLDALYDELHGGDRLQRHLIQTAIKGNSILNELNIILDPGNSGIKIKNINNLSNNDFNKYSSDGCEMWTDSPCLFIRDDVFRNHIDGEIR